MDLTDEQKEKFSKVGKSNVRTAKNHERRVARLMTDWSNRPFRRRRVEGRGEDVKVVEGVADVIPIDGDIIFAIEAKKGKDFSLDGLMTNPEKAVFTEWWHQATYDAKILTERTNIERYPMVFFKPHPNWDWVAVPFQTFQSNILRPMDSEAEYTDRRKCSEVWFPHLHFDAYCWLGPVSMNVSRTKKKENKVMVELNLPPVVFCRWRDFEAHVDPESIFIQI